MRLFVSCFIPKEISDYIKSLAEKLPEAKITAPRNIDLTVKFLGTVQADQLEKIKEKLAKIEFEPFEAELDGLGVFPNEQFIRVVWAGVKPEDKFNELHEKVDKALQEIFPAEKKFKPHLTIARVKKINDKQLFVNELKKIKVELKKFKINKLVLLESKLSPKGAVHKQIMEIKSKPL